MPLDFRTDYFAEAKALTYSHSPPSANIEDAQAPPREPGPVPYDLRANTTDPLTAFLAQSAPGIQETEAERIGSDRFGMSWPMMRAQRLHCGDSHVLESLDRRLYAESRMGMLFTPLETPQNPKTLYRSLPAPISGFDISGFTGDIS